MSPWLKRGTHSRTTVSRVWCESAAGRRRSRALARPINGGSARESRCACPPPRASPVPSSGRRTDENRLRGGTAPSCRSAPFLPTPTRWCAYLPVPPTRTPLERASPPRDHSDEQTPSQVFIFRDIYWSTSDEPRTSIPLRASILEGRVVLFNCLNELNFIQAHIFLKKYIQFLSLSFFTITYETTRSIHNYFSHKFLVIIGNLVIIGKS